MVALPSVARRLQLTPGVSHTRQSDMFLIPYRRFDLESHLPPAVVSQRLRDMKDDRGFGGNVWGQGFSLSERVGRARLTELYAAQVQGSFSVGSRGGTRISAIMSLHPLELAVVLCAIV